MVMTTELPDGAAQPNAKPPAQAGGVGAATQARPTLTPPDNQAIQAARAKAAGAAAPTLPLPGMQAGGAAAHAAGTVWNNNQTLNALWSINQDRNSWVGVANVGWVRLSGASDTGVMTLSMLAAHARQMSSIVSYRQEDDGLIHEMYVW